jgi:hypothetical protein
MKGYFTRISKVRGRAPSSMRVFPRIWERDPGRGAESHLGRRIFKAHSMTMIEVYSHDE